MRAYIVRPFGVQSYINFEAVQRELIDPALNQLGIDIGITESFLQAGNIRIDLFQQLLVADLVVADISIHNASVFYELGIRHALQTKRTFLMRAKKRKQMGDRTREDEVPFDLKTDRYLEYDCDNLSASLPKLVEALRQTIASENRDSPVFQMLPDLDEQDRTRFIPVPQSFSEDVELAAKSRRIGLLGLLATEARDFFWGSEGLRLIGRAQLELRAYTDARRTWEELHMLNPTEPEANQRLSTIYQRLGNMDASDLAIQRVIHSRKASRNDRAEALSLLGRNLKVRWRASWSEVPPEQAAIVAFESPHLLGSYEKYFEAFQENLDGSYLGVNALSMLTVHLELAVRFSQDWEDRFDSKGEADLRLGELRAAYQDLSSAVRVSLKSHQSALRKSGAEDRWLSIAAADLEFLTSSRPKRVAFAYQNVLRDASDVYVDSVRDELEIFQTLAVLPENTRAALATFPSTAKSPTPQALLLGRVVLFTGHMIDEPGRPEPRFPDTVRDKARAAIRVALEQQIARTKGAIVAIASGANGGDLLFHEVCEELQIPHELFLPLPPDVFRNESVSPGGRYWQDQFDQLLGKSPRAPVLSGTPLLPRWLTARAASYTPWQRANFWLVEEALALAAQNFTLLALWDGVPTRGVGGTAHMCAIAQQAGATFVHIPTADFLRSDTQNIRQFFSKAGFDPTDAPDGNSFILRKGGGGVEASVIMFQPERPLNMAVMIPMKTYIVYRDKMPAADQLQAVRVQCKSDVIPISASIVELALYDKKTCSDTLHELEEPFVARTDPYNESKPITDPIWFFGREDILKDLPAVLRQGQHSGLFGLRKMGKTSLIKQLQQRLISVPTVWIDCQGFPAKAEPLFQEICSQLRTELRRKIGFLDEGSSVQDFRSEIIRLFSEWEAASGQGPFVLILDEVDILFPDRRLTGSDETLREWVKLFRVLRALSQEKSCLVTLVTAYRPDVNGQNLISPEIGENPMFMSFQEWFLGSLSREDTLRMISEIGAWKDISWSCEALAELYELCGGHPLLTRLFASDACERGEVKAIDLPRVRAVADTIRKQFYKHLIGRYFEESIWKLLQRDEQQALVAIASDGPVVDLAQAIGRLERFGLISGDNGSLRVSSTLLRSWLKKEGSA